MKTDYIVKLKQICQSLPFKELADQVTTISNLEMALQKQVILAQAPQPLGLLPDQLSQLSHQCVNYQKQSLHILNQLVNNARNYFAWHYGVWSLPNLETAKLLQKNFELQKGLEIMAGNACWSKALSQTGIQMTATDSCEWAKSSQTGQHLYYPVHHMSAPEAILQYPHVDFILCSWAPNFNQADLTVLKQWRQMANKPKLFFVAEKNGATNSPQFWHEALLKQSIALKQVNASFKSFDFIREHIFEIG